MSVADNPFDEIAMVCRLARHLGALSPDALASPRRRSGAYPAAEFTAVTPEHYARIDRAAFHAESLRRALMQREPVQESNDGSDHATTD